MAKKISQNRADVQKKKKLQKFWLKYVADDILNLTFFIVVGVVIIGY